MDFCLCLRVGLSSCLVHYTVSFLHEHTTGLCVLAYVRVCVCVCVFDSNECLDQTQQFNGQFSKTAMSPQLQCTEGERDRDRQREGERERGREGERERGREGDGPREH